MEHVIIPLILFGMIFGIVYVVVAANNKENMAMIEAGMNPKGPKIKKHSSLRFAMLAIFIPIGILVGNTTYRFFEMDYAPAAVVFGFLFGGIGLIITHIITEKQKPTDTIDHLDEEQ